ncbi:MAG TPA: SGNH/GDSL hydrolase family protein [Planctomycetota bacterium]|nr:SGNH/GDSL hydrolase family protein [Planctomycetota bacterium]
MKRLRPLGAFGLGLLGAALAAELLLRIAALFAPGPRAAAALPEGAPTVLCVGDSHTYGLFVGDSESYPAQLGARLAGARVRVVNAGRPALNSSLLVPHAREWIARTRPRVLVVRVGINDFWNDARPDGSLLDSLRVVRLARVLFSRRAAGGADLPPAGDRLPTAPMRSDLERLGECVGVRGALEANVRSAVREARAAGAAAVLLAYSLDFHYYAVVNEGLERIAGEEGALFADPSPLARRAASAEGYPSVFLPDFHPNARGYALEAGVVAEAIARAAPALLPRPTTPEAGADGLPPFRGGADQDLRDLEAAIDVAEKEIVLLRRNLSPDALPILRGHGRRLLEALSHPALREVLRSHPRRAAFEEAARAFDEAAAGGDLEAARRAVEALPRTIRAK